MIRWLARMAVENAVAVNLATLAVCGGGLLLYFSMPREVFPEFSMGTVRVTTLWPGAAPEDVEQLVTLPIEDELEGTDGLDEMASLSQEGLSTVTLRIESGYDVQEFLDDVRAAMSRDLELPESSEEPVVQEVVTEFPAIAVFVYGHRSEDELRVLAERHQRELEKIDGVSEVQLLGPRPPRIWVEVEPLALERFGLTLADVGAAVGARSRDAPLGTLSTAAGDFLLRVDADVEGAEALRDLPLLQRPDGTAVRLHQIARVSDTFQRRTARARFQGLPCMRLQVNKRARGDSISISKEVFAYLDRVRGELPSGVAIGANSDMSVYVRNRLDVMRSSATLGGLLVLVSLVMFLSVRVALMTALGIPIAFLGGLLLAGAMGITMNMLTMFALIVVLGMIVDDAIVVGENVYRRMEEGQSPREAAIEGTAEVGRPVLATILTTVAAFLPILMVGGTTGMFLRPLPVVVSFCLAASLLEALLVLPSHLAHWTGRTGGVARAERGAARRWYDPARDAYVTLLELAVRWRYVTVALTLSVALGMAGFAYARMPFNLFDDFESKVFYVNVRAPADASLEETEALALPIEERVAELLRPVELESLNTLYGVSYANTAEFSVGQNLAQIWVELREGVDGRRGTLEIIEALREAFADPPPGVVSIDVDQPQAGPSGRAVDVSIRGPEIAVLRELAARVEDELEKHRGVRDVRDNFEVGKREVVLSLKDHGRLLGFTEAGLGAELRAAFEGTRFARVRRGEDDVEVVVKLPEELRSRRGELERLRVTAPGGARVPLGAVAEVRERDALAVVTRDDGERSIRVFADVNKELGNAREINEAVGEAFADVGSEYPGYFVELKGDAEETAESMAGLLRSTLIAILAIYLVLGTLFRSLTQPMVIMFAIPFALIGMVGGHLLMGRGLSLMSLIGATALAGVVVNDSLILVDFVNIRRARGEPLVGALIESGRLRFRPILLTSITTMLGLSPLTFFASGQARFLQPMAITIFFGLAAATGLILVVIPCAYGILADVHELARRPRAVIPRLLRGRPIHDRALHDPSQSP